MDKQTLSHYGWIVVCALVATVMIAFATPFGEFATDSAASIAKGFIDAGTEASSEKRQEEIVNRWEDKWLSDAEGGNTNTPEEGLKPGATFANGTFLTWDELKTKYDVTDTSIKEQAFKRCTDLTSIVIPESVTTISAEAFVGCNALTSVTIPDSVQGIGTGAFGGCSALTSITIPKSIEGMGSEVFASCSSLKQVTIQEGVSAITTSTFYGCVSLESITIPTTVTNIGTNAFYNCKSLTTINFNGIIAQWNAINKNTNWNNGIAGAKVYCTDGTVDAVIPGAQFTDGTWLSWEDMKKSENEKGFSSSSVQDDIIAREAFSENKTIKELVLPTTITSIGREAFYASKLEKITIHNSITQISTEAFAYSSLSSIVFIGTMEQWNAITKGTNWCSNNNVTVVQCRDGDVSIK